MSWTKHVRKGYKRGYSNVILSMPPAAVHDCGHVAGPGDLPGLSRGPAAARCARLWPRGHPPQGPAWVHPREGEGMGLGAGMSYNGYVPLPCKFNKKYYLGDCYNYKLCLDNSNQSDRDSNPCVKELRDWEFENTHFLATEAPYVFLRTYKICFKRYICYMYRVDVSCCFYIAGLDGRVEWWRKTESSCK